MSGTFPTTINIPRVELENDRGNARTDSQAFTRSVRQRLGAQRWAAKVNFETLTETEIAKVVGFLAKQSGSFGKFQFTLTGYPSPQGVATGTPVVNGASQTGKSVDTSGWTASTTGILLASSAMVFAGHTKVYMLTDDADSDGSGDATLNIEPELLASPADSAAITINNVQMTVEIPDKWKWAIRPGIFGSIPVEFTEVINQ